MLNSIIENIFSNMEAPIVFLIVAIVLRVANIILGSIDAMFKKDFDWGKLNFLNRHFRRCSVF